MRILPIKGVNTGGNNSARACNKQHGSGSCEYIIPSSDGEDIFVKAEKLSCRGTSGGNPLKRLKHVRCAYFDVETLSGKEIDGIEKRLDKTTTVKEVVSILYKYRRFMHKVEKAIYRRFVEYARTNPNASLSECLKKWYNDAITKLKLEEFNVLDDVDKISLNLSPQNALAVHSQTTNCRQVILENNKEDTFKRKTLLSSLEQIKPSRKERKIFELLQDRALYLPTSSSSENAFIVKYASRSHQEIAKRILRPSFATIEHVKPSCEEGENNIANFVLTSASANNARSNMPLTKFISMYPKIPKNCQKYILSIIERIHKGQFTGYETYPYQIRRTLLRESKGIINLDLSTYKYSESEAKNIEKNKYKKN